MKTVFSWQVEPSLDDIYWSLFTQITISAKINKSNMLGYYTVQKPFTLTNDVEHSSPYFLDIRLRSVAEFESPGRNLRDKKSLRNRASIHRVSAKQNANSLGNKNAITMK